jgi:hypothetical protein
MTSFVIGIAIMCMTSLFFLFVFGFFAYLRYLKHKELMAFAEKGLLPPEPALRKGQENSGSLRQAIILIGVGAALCIGLYPIGWIAMPGQLPLNLGPWMVAGLIPLFFGLGLLLIHFLPTIQSLLDHSVTRFSEDAEAAPEVEPDTASPREAPLSTLDTHEAAASTGAADRLPTRAAPPADR